MSALELVPITLREARAFAHPTQTKLRWERAA
jgi:hypothetical protein